MCRTSSALNMMLISTAWGNSHQRNFAGSRYIRIREHFGLLLNCKATKLPELARRASTPSVSILSSLMNPCVSIRLRLATMYTILMGAQLCVSSGCFDSCLSESILDWVRVRASQLSRERILLALKSCLAGPERAATSRNSSGRGQGVSVDQTRQGVAAVESVSSYMAE